MFVFKKKFGFSLFNKKEDKVVPYRSLRVQKTSFISSSFLMSHEYSLYSPNKKQSKINIDVGKEPVEYYSLPDDQEPKSESPVNVRLIHK